MRVVVAGATGVLGRRLVPLLSSVGHSVTALARRPGGVVDGAADVRAVDLLDADAVRRVVVEAAPEAVIHVATAIPAALNPRRMRRDFSQTNRLRIEGTANLIDAAGRAGGARVVSQGLAYVYEPGDGLANEDAEWWRRPPGQWRSSLEALRRLERQTVRADGLVLRLGHLYGPGTAFDVNGSVTGQIRSGGFPLVGDGGSVFSFTHTHDAATAFVSALTRRVSGALNVVDDDPAPVSRWLPEAAGFLGAPMPKRFAVTLARMAVGGWGVAYMTRLRGADNARARLALNWRPRHTSWRDGLAYEWGTR